MKIAVLGAGISGLGSAYLLSQKHEVDLYEKEGRLGGHARTTMVEEEGKRFGVDTGFLVFNHPTYPLLTKLFEKLGVKIENSDMSFGFWDEASNNAYNGQSLGGLFFQKKSLFSPAHYRMILDIMRFNKTANADIESNNPALDVSLGEYLSSYSDVFKERYLIPMGAAIWSTPSDKMNDFPARTFVQFFKNHGLLGVTTQHQWLTVSGGSKNYVEKIAQKISGKIILNADVIRMKRHDRRGDTLSIKTAAKVTMTKWLWRCMHPKPWRCSKMPPQKKKRYSHAFAYKENEALLHNDQKALYPDKKIYAAWNYKTGGKDNAVTLSYWINKLQNLDSKKEYFVSLNETSQLDNVIEKISYEHPQFDGKAIQMQARRDEINGENNTYYAGAYWRYGFHEDGLWSANTIAQSFGCAL